MGQNCCRRWGDSKLRGRGTGGKGEDWQGNDQNGRNQEVDEIGGPLTNLGIVEAKVSTNCCFRGVELGLSNG